MPHVNQAAAATAKMPPAKLPAPATGQDLENVELLMALEAQHLGGCGFDASVRKAAESVGAEFLFNIPAPSSLPFQRAALVRLPESNRQVVLVTLSADGTTMDAQMETPDTAYLFRLGEAWLAGVDQFRRLS